jgi:hypothetical protein
LDLLPEATLKKSLISQDLMEVFTQLHAQAPKLALLIQISYLLGGSILPNGGGIAWIGSSVTSGGDHGNWHVRYYHEEMWKDSHDYHHHNLGRAFAEAKTRMIENFPDPACNPSDPPWHCRWCRYHAIIWNLVGDPLVPLFNHMPGTLDVMLYPQMVEPDIATTLSITVEDDGDPVEGALVCLMKSR